MFDFIGIYGIKCAFHNLKSVVTWFSRKCVTFLSDKYVIWSRGISWMSWILILSYRLREVTISYILHCFFMVFAQVVVYATSAMSIIYGGCWCYKKLHYHDYYYYYFTELFISLQQDVQLRWGLDHNVTFSMGKWFILKNQNWILPTCDSFPLIMSPIFIIHLGILYEIELLRCKLWFWNTQNSQLQIFTNRNSTSINFVLVSNM